MIGGARSGIRLMSDLLRQPTKMLTHRANIHDASTTVPPAFCIQAWRSSVPENPA